MPNSKSNYQICVSGAAAGPSVEASKDKAVALGKAIAKAGSTLLTGATVGLPNYAALGCKQAGGLSVGISPAASKLEHVKKYRLPTENYDVVLYTGLHYTGRDTLLVNCSDAVASLGGRLGTLHEFTVAMETETPIGFLNGSAQRALGGALRVHCTGVTNTVARDDIDSVAGGIDNGLSERWR